MSVFGIPQLWNSIASLRLSNRVIVTVFSNTKPIAYKKSMTHGTELATASYNGGKGVTELATAFCNGGNDVMKQFNILL